MFSLKIISPSETVFSGEVDFVLLPGSRGELGILPRHAPLLATLKKGKISLRQKEGIKTFEILGGFVQVLQNEVTVLLK